MCVGGGGGGGAKAKPVYSTKQTDEAMQEGIFENAVMNQNRDKMKAGSGSPYSEGTIGGSGWSQLPGGKKSHWTSNPTWDQKQSDKSFGG